MVFQYSFVLYFGSFLSLAVVFAGLLRRYIYIDSNRKRRVASVGNIGKLPSREASCRYVRQVAVTCCRGTSVARSLKLLTLPQVGKKKRITIIILSTNRSYVISPCVTNTL